MSFKICKIIGNFEHKIFLMEHKGADWKEFVETYRAMQDAVHKQAEKYRALGLICNDRCQEGDKGRCKVFLKPKAS